MFAPHKPAKLFIDGFDYCLASLGASDLVADVAMISFCIFSNKKIFIILQWKKKN
jgi:hypothetical protein